MAIRWITPQILAPTIDGAWHDVDISAYVSASCTGIFLHILASSAEEFAVRKNGSTDNRIPANLYRHYWAAVGVDNSKIFEFYGRSGGTFTVLLVGYTETETVWFDNAKDITIAGAGAYHDVDISAYVGADTPIAAFGQFSVGEFIYAIRCNGSVNDFYQYGKGSFSLIGVDASKLLEIKVSNTACHYYLMGYVKSGANLVVNINGTDISLGSTGAYANLSALPLTATGAFIEVHYTSVANNNFALRTKGLVEDYYYYNYHAWAYVQSDNNRIIEGKIASTSVDFYLTAYTTTPSTLQSIGFKSLKGVGK